jgi:hypothetical protein
LSEEEEQPNPQPERYRMFSSIFCISALLAAAVVILMDARS